MAINTKKQPPCLLMMVLVYFSVYNKQMCIVWWHLVLQDMGFGGDGACLATAATMTLLKIEKSKSFCSHSHDGQRLNVTMVTSQ